ncbi:tetratricopeptide repeat protein [Spirosoma endophyticum]|uniref:Tetratricopeptide repeat-containing protein n=1 Tax=Spirosoma endophyticum TaxID=662367 RepID=A0A1I1P8J8_9BACT|nr:tetratricopeptide repeat protein [Spirosoma endophyticum]SFD06035.1 Tetratricopeptide repeat-containing protein [Spirosoma endophyticum]
MMNNQKQSLLTILFVGATMATPLLAQDVQTALKDIEAERYTKAGQTLTQLATSSPTADNQFYLGYYYLKSGQIDKAKAAFEKGAAADSKNQLNNIGLAGVALAKSDGATAKTLIDNAVAQTKSKNQDVLIRGAEMYTLSEQPKQNDPAAALSLLTIADEKDKKNENAEIEMLMGDAYFLKNDGGNAITKYENALAISPTLAEANYKIGRLYLRGKNYTKAQEFFKLAIQGDPEFAPTYRAYADALANSRAYKAAAQNYELYVQKSGTTDPEQLLDIARYKFLAQDYQGAITYLDQLKGKINNPIIDRMYGWAYSALGKNNESVESLNRFISTAPQKVMVDDYKYLGRAYGQLGTPEGDSLSVANLEKAAPMDTTENLYREIGEKYYKTKKYDKAATYYAKTIANDKKPQNNDFLWLGLSNYQYAPRVGRDSTAAPIDTAQIPQVKQQYYLRADSAFTLMAQKIEADGKKYPLAYYYRAGANYYAYPNDKEKAAALAGPLYEKFIEQAMAPDSSDKTDYKRYLITSYKALAGFSLLKKDDAKAKEYFDKVLAIDPNDESVKKALEGPKPAPTPTQTRPTPKAPAKKKVASK